LKKLATVRTVSEIRPIEGADMMTSEIKKKVRYRGICCDCGERHDRAEFSKVRYMPSCVLEKAY